MLRRSLAVLAFLAAPLLLSACTSADAQELPAITVFKSPTCGCCKKWVTHLEENGFEVTVQDVDDMNVVRARFGIPHTLRACHTGVIENYVVEGHVPASDVKRLLEERPDVAGIGVPGMPVGSPGMEVPGREAEPYDVQAFNKAGETAVFSSH